MGNTEDLTAYEPDGIECRKCGYKWLFDEDCREIIGPENLDYEVGKAEA